MPILQKLIDEKKQNENPVLRALIIAPTRELVKQIVNSIDDYAKYLDIKRVAVFGGESKNLQAKRVANNPSIVVATTGRLLEHIKDGTINLASVNYVVIDELDVMLDMGFIKDLEAILPTIKKNRHISMFSATINSSVKKLAKEFLNNPAVIEVTTQRQSVDSISHEAILVDEDRKLEALSFLIGSKNISQVLVFVNQKDEANAIVENLNLDGLKAACIHGDIRQSSRALALRKFKEKEIRVLVATDITARGIDIENLPCVVNFSLPQSIIDFTHRVGRTGRAGNSGTAITFLSVKDYKFFADIEKELIIVANRYELDGFKTLEKKPRAKQKAKKSIKEIKTFTKTKDKKPNKFRKTTKRG